MFFKSKKKNTKDSKVESLLEKELKEYDSIMIIFESSKIINNGSISSQEKLVFKQLYHKYWSGRIPSSKLYEEIEKYNQIK